MTNQSTRLKRVAGCYQVFDAIWSAAGLRKFTEGRVKDPEAPYIEAEAQLNQLQFLLDQAQVTAGSRLIEIGCGNGELLEAAGKRGIRATGITLSPEQIAWCQKRNLDAKLLEFSDIPESWYGQFDAAIGNGPFEHFVQPEDALNDRADEIYHETFRVLRQLLSQKGQRLVTTTINARHLPDPHDLLTHPLRFPWKSDKFFAAWIHRCFGGYYPAIGQFERCASPYFRLVNEEDGTLDYHLTSEFWFRRVRQCLLRSPKMWWHCCKLLTTLPGQTLDILIGVVWCEAWQWQFRGNPPPVKQLRQTWEAC